MPLSAAQHAAVSFRAALEFESRRLINGESLARVNYDVSGRRVHLARTASASSRSRFFATAVGGYEPVAMIKVIERSGVTLKNPRK